MSSKAYIILKDDLTLSDRKEYRVGALAAGICRAIKLGIVNWDRKDMGVGADPSDPSVPDIHGVKNYLLAGGWPKVLDVREFQPILDAGCALDQWNTAALAAVGAEYSVFQAIAAPAVGLRVKKVAIWFGCQVETTPIPVSRILFRRNTATGILQAEFDLEQLVTGQEINGYFSEPVIWDNNTAYAINVMARIATGVLARVQLKNFVLEPAGTTNA